MSREMTNQEAIANLNHIYGFLSPNIQRSLDVAFKAMERQKGEWILVSERLPEEEGDYLITPYRYNVTIDHFVNGKFVFFNNNAIAWQPLPEPYKRGGADMRGKEE